MRVPRDSGHDCCVALTGEQASNAALIVHLITFGLAIVFVGVAICGDSEGHGDPPCVISLGPAAL